jgi:hypothetical protein
MALCVVRSTPAAWAIRRLRRLGPDAILAERWVFTSSRSGSSCCWGKLAGPLSTPGGALPDPDDLHRRNDAHRLRDIVLPQAWRFGCGVRRWPASSCAAGRPDSSSRSSTAYQAEPTTRYPRGPRVCRISRQCPFAPAILLGIPARDGRRPPAAHGISEHLQRNAVGPPRR